MLFGVLDGHGGTYVSEFAVEAIPKVSEMLCSCSRTSKRVILKQM